MSPNLTLAILVGVLSACGVYLFLSRSLVRVLFGVLLMGNGINLLYLIASGPAGRAPISDINSEAEMSDPLPQAMVLTAIVITLAMTAFLLALAHRSWQVTRTDLVEVDPEDARISRKADVNDYTDETLDEEPPEMSVPEAVAPEGSSPQEARREPDPDGAEPQESARPGGER